MEPVLSYVNPYVKCCVVFDFGAAFYIPILPNRAGRKILKPTWIKRNPAATKAARFLAHGSGRRIRTLTYGVRVRCATFTQSRYVLTNKNFYTGFERFVNSFFPSPEKIHRTGRRGGMAASCAAEREESVIYSGWPAPDRRRSGICPEACRQWRRSAG